MGIELYKYSDIKISENKQAYHYSSYSGRLFFDAWKTKRQFLEKESIPKFSPPPPAIIFMNKDSEIVETKPHLERLYGESSKKTVSCFAFHWIEKFLKKFETTHRLHEAYNINFRAVNKNEHKDLSLYVRFAEICVNIFENTSDLRYLNALIKILDVLVYERENLDHHLLERAAALSKKEQEFVKFLAAKYRLKL